MELYRPTGLAELKLVFDMDLTGWPPRLPEQPIFYPVLNYDYAREIAEQWNTTETTAVGYVTQFDVDDTYIERFKVETVGARRHQELWIPAEELKLFNSHIVGRIRVVDAFFGNGYVGDPTVIDGRPLNVHQQTMLLTDLDSSADVTAFIGEHRRAVFCNYLYWVRTSPAVARRVAASWSELDCDLPLPVLREPSGAATAEPNSQ